MQVKMTEDPVPPKSDNSLHSLKHQLSFTTLNSDRIEKIKRGAGAAGQIFPLYSSFFYRHVNRCCMWTFSIGESYNSLLQICQ